MHADETGLNLDGKRHWLHVLPAPKCILFGLSPKRGTEVMNAMGVLPSFKGTLVHDHWKPYYTYRCNHALCNAHHLRELIYTDEVDERSYSAEVEALMVRFSGGIGFFRSCALWHNGAFALVAASRPTGRGF